MKFRITKVSFDFVNLELTVFMVTPTKLSKLKNDVLQYSFSKWHLINNLAFKKYLMF